MENKAYITTNMPVLAAATTFDVFQCEAVARLGCLGHDATMYNSFRSTESLPFSSVSTRITTPSQTPSPLVRQHGPILLPKIRSQDQNVDSQLDQDKTLYAPAATPQRSGSSTYTHLQGFTNPGMLNSFFNPLSPNEDKSNLFQTSLYSLAAFPQDNSRSILNKHDSLTFHQMPSGVMAVSQDPNKQPLSLYSNFAPYDPSLSLTSISGLTPNTILMNYLTTSNPAPSLVRAISVHFRDPNTRHSWWDVRQVRPWSSFNLKTILALPGASSLLKCPVPQLVLQQPKTSKVRHPETEAALHSLYATYYVPKLNTALAVSSQRPLQFSVTFPESSGSIPAGHHSFIVNMVDDESLTIANKFGGKPTARIVGLVKSFNRFNTGMRVDGNVKRVEYLCGLAHLHHMMREHGTRYGFILTEIELVIVRNGTQSRPHFGYLEVASVQLAAAADVQNDDDEIPFTACLALWGLCMMAGDEPAPGQAYWKAEIGAPAENLSQYCINMV